MGMSPVTKLMVFVICGPRLSQPREWVGLPLSNVFLCRIWPSLHLLGILGPELPFLVFSLVRSSLSKCVIFFYRCPASVTTRPISWTESTRTTSFSGRGSESSALRITSKSRYLHFLLWSAQPYLATITDFFVIYWWCVAWLASSYFYQWSNGFVQKYDW